MNFEKGTKVHGSCGATLNGRNWIIGGWNEKRQVSDLSNKPRRVYDVLDKSNRWMQHQKNWKLGI